MKQIILFATILLTSPLWGDGRAVAQSANEPGSGNCLSFNNSAINYVKIDTLQTFATTEISIAFWLRTSATNEAGIISYGLPPANFDALVIFSPSNIGFSLNNIETVVTGVAVNDNTWHHLAFTWVSATGAINVYRDGVLAYSGTIQTGASTSIGGTLVFGQEQGLVIGGDFILQKNYEGLLDEISIWNLSLTQAQIQNLMCKKLTGTEIGLSGYWRFDEGVDGTCFGGKDVCDATGNGNNGVKF